MIPATCSDFRGAESSSVSSGNSQAVTAPRYIPHFAALFSTISMPNVSNIVLQNSERNGGGLVVWISSGDLSGVPPRRCRTINRGGGFFLLG